MSKLVFVVGSVAAALMLDAFTATVVTANAERRPLGRDGSPTGLLIQAADQDLGSLGGQTHYYTDLAGGKPARRHPSVRPVLDPAPRQTM